MSNLDQHPRFCEDCGAQECDEVAVKPRPFYDENYQATQLCDECYNHTAQFANSNITQDATGYSEFWQDVDAELWNKGGD